MGAAGFVDLAAAYRFSTLALGDFALVLHFRTGADETSI
tara:strand:- start:79 stop:195 length:117 start_codon:yes stop_codon:yes gene_type:complete